MLTHFLRPKVKLSTMSEIVLQTLPVMWSGYRILTYSTSKTESKILNNAWYHLANNKIMPCRSGIFHFTFPVIAVYAKPNKITTAVSVFVDLLLVSPGKRPQLWSPLKFPWINKSISQFNKDAISKKWNNFCMEIQAVGCFSFDPVVSIVEILHERQRSAMATDDNFVINSHAISFVLRYYISHISLSLDSCFATCMLSITGINAIYVLLCWLELPSRMCLSANR